MVLFPHALLPLHIFEERYRAMMRDVLTGTRFLAISLLVPDARAEEELPAVQPIAGVGEVVMAHELPDGRFNLVVRGRARIRIDRELPSGRPYRLVTATVLPDLPSPTRPSWSTPTRRCARSSVSWPTPSPRGASCCARSSPLRTRPPSWSTSSPRR